MSLTKTLLVRSIFFAFAIATLMSCQKNKTFGCDAIPIPSVWVDPVVEAGGAIHLEVENIPGAVSYQWTGPGGFTSSERKLVIERAQSNHAGRYKVLVGFVGGCAKTVTSDSVIVSIPPAACTPTNNTSRLAGAAYLNFDNIISTPAGSYHLKAYGPYGQMEIEFANTNKPAAGVYTIQPLGGEWRYGNARVEVLCLNTYWSCTTGKVYVSLNNNKVTATFCDLPVSESTFGMKTTMSGKLTEE